MAQTKLKILFDGGCPLCKQEVAFLRSRDRKKSILFVDIDSSDYKPELYSGITYRDAMKRIHAITSSGLVLTDIKVFKEAYGLVGLGWIYEPTTWPVLGTLVNYLYKIWSRFRLPLTNRASLNELCKVKNTSSCSLK